LSGSALSSSLVGTEFEPSTFAWTQRDCVLYALGIGARPDEELDFLYERRGPVTFPTYAVIPGMGVIRGLGKSVKLDFTRLLHGEQAVTRHRSLPACGELTLEGRICEVWDKGNAAVIGVEGTASDEDGPLFSVYSSLFFIGAGGFGGERGPSSRGVNTPPDREPDVVVELETRAEQAAIYRLSGDTNPMHIDPEFATAAGFEGVFLHGLCTYGFVGRAVLKGLCDGDVEQFGSLRGRFADQVWPGDRIITKMWLGDDGAAILRAETQTGAIVFNHASAIVGRNDP